MSGIVGIHRSDGAPVDRTVLARMLAAIAHRGSDREGHWVSGPIGMGHRLLFTTPESLREHQPVTDAGGRWAVVWDGRLDNREELIRLLEQSDIALGAKTDPDLVLEAYQQWGEDCPQKLLGDFAFAVWDERNRSLFCSRDRMGLRPFHYVWDGTTFLFGSEIRPLCAARGNTPEPDDEMILAFLLREFREPDQERTLFQGIRRVPPGHSLRLKEGRARVWRYWDIDPAVETRYARDEDYADHFRSLFQEAVKCRLRSFFPVGASVSGGLHSSAILCTAERLGAPNGETFPPIEAFTLFSDDPASDERAYFNDTINATGVKSHAVRATDDSDPLSTLDSLIRQVESPIAGPGYGEGAGIRALFMTRGCRVLLSGEGGDQLLDEIGYLSDILAGLDLWRFMRETRAMARWYGGDPWEFAGMACSLLLPSMVKYWGKRIVRGVPPPWMNAELARTVGLRARIREPRHRMRFPSFCQADAWLSVCGPYYVLKHEVDERSAASLGVEIRYPFLDSRLVEFILSVPSARRTRNGVRQRLLREAMRGTMPETVRMRKGKGDWTASADLSLTALCRRDPPAPLANVSGRMERYCTFEGMRNLVNRYLDGEGDLRWDVWFLIALDHWLAQLAQGGWHGRTQTHV